MMLFPTFASAEGSGSTVQVVGIGVAVGQIGGGEMSRHQRLCCGVAVVDEYHSYKVNTQKHQIRNRKAQVQALRKVLAWFKKLGA